MDIIKTLAAELSIPVSQITSTVELIDAGNTIPFIARYRKEVTGGLDDTQLRDLHERLTYLRGLQKRKEEVSSSIASRASSARRWPPRWPPPLPLPRWRTFTAPIAPSARPAPRWPGSGACSHWPTRCLPKPPALTLRRGRRLCRRQARAARCRCGAFGRAGYCGRGGVRRRRNPQGTARVPLPHRDNKIYRK